jgi:hypothetical protein
MTIVIFLFQFRYRGVDLHLDRSLANGRVKDLISFLHNKLKKVCISSGISNVIFPGGHGK